MTKRQLRGLAIFNRCKDSLNQHRELYLFPLFSSLINTILFGMILFPRAKSEFRTLSHIHQHLGEFIGLYLQLILFFYARDLINGLFNVLQLFNIKLIRNNKPLHLSHAFIEMKPLFWNIIRWYSFTSLIGGYYAILCRSTNLKPKRKITQGAYYRYSLSLANVMITYQKIKPRQALAQAGSKINAIWGHPPIRQGFTMGHLFLKYLLFCIAPITITFLFLPHHQTLLYVTGTISAIGVLLFSIYAKTTHSLIEYAQHAYVMQKKIVTPLDAECIKYFYKSTQ